MIVEYIRYELDQGVADDLVDAYRDAAAIVAGNPHCLGFDIARCLEEPGHVTIRMHWDSTAGHLEGFCASPAFKEYSTLVRPFASGIAEMRHYAPAGGPGFADARA